MPGKHADGYRAAYAVAIREAAVRWKNGIPGGPDQWRQLLDETLTARGLKGGGEG